MEEPQKDQEKGDEVLRRLLKTPPDPKTGKAQPKNESVNSDEKSPADTSGKSRGDRKI
ncbi:MULTISPECIES: hypothetical protein [unclassified Mesorhizobium]|uniref:hypothetical protein n=1 Tax=unclassified Mesorhizobium TaxID=325217 RepID=UPI0015E2FD7C|nr:MULTISPECIES: hypothetical protein [unclassified Mesorhizobium]